MLALRPWSSVLLAVLLACLVPPASAQNVILDAPGFLEKKKAPPPPPPRAPPTVWPRLDPGAVLCRTEDDLDRHAANMTARVSGGATMTADCRIIARPIGIQILSRQGPGHTQVKLSATGTRPAGPMSGCRTRRPRCDSATPRMVDTHHCWGRPGWRLGRHRHAPGRLHGADPADWRRDLAPLRAAALVKGCADRRTGTPGRRISIPRSAMPTKASNCCWATESPRWMATHIASDCATDRACPTTDCC